MVLTGRVEKIIQFQLKFQSHATFVTGQIYVITFQENM